MKLPKAGQRSRPLLCSRLHTTHRRMLQQAAIPSRPHELHRTPQTGEAPSVQRPNRRSNSRCARQPPQPASPGSTRGREGRSSSPPMPGRRVSAGRRGPERTSSAWAPFDAGALPVALREVNCGGAPRIVPATDQGAAERAKTGRASSPLILRHQVSRRRPTADRPPRSAQADRNLSALKTTLTDDRLIARAAISGDSSRPNAG